MLNNLVLIVFLAIIAVGWFRKNPIVYLTASIVFTFAAPVLVLGSRKINSSYLLTAMLFLLVILEITLKRKVKYPFPSALKIYLRLMAIVLFTYTVGFLLHGTAGLRPFILSMAGEVNIILLTALLVFLLAWVQRFDRFRIFYLAGWIFAGLQFVMVLFQKLFFEPAWRFTYQLYAGDGRTEPLETILVSDPPFFKRAYGTFYSPTLFGLASLVPTLIFGYLTIASYANSKKMKDDGDMEASRVARRQSLINLSGCFLSGLVGTFSLSKGFMLSIGILLVYLFIIVLIMGKHPRRYYLVPWGYLAAVVMSAFVIVYVSMPSFASGTRDYYFGFLLNPFNALTSRYGNGESAGGESHSLPIAPAGANEAILAISPPEQKLTLDSAIQAYAPGTNIPLPTDSSGNVLTPHFEELSSSSGQMAETYNVFREHWLTGVGPLPIDDEFLGDSQVVQVGHNGGVLALAAYLTLFIWLYVKGFREKRAANLLLMPIIAIACVSIAFLGQIVSVGVMSLALCAALQEEPIA